MSDDGPQSTGETLSKQPVDTSNPTDGKQTTPRQNAADPEFEMELERIRLDAKYERDRKRDARRNAPPLPAENEASTPGPKPSPAPQAPPPSATPASARDAENREIAGNPAGDIPSPRSSTQTPAASGDRGANSEAHTKKLDAMNENPNPSQNSGQNTSTASPGFAPSPAAGPKIYPAPPPPPASPSNGLGSKAAVLAIAAALGLLSYYLSTLIPHPAAQPPSPKPEEMAGLKQQIEALSKQQETLQTTLEALNQQIKVSQISHPAPSEPAPTQEDKIKADLQTAKTFLENKPPPKCNAEAERLLKELQTDYDIKGLDSAINKDLRDKMKKIKAIPGCPQ